MKKANLLMTLALFALTGCGGTSGLERSDVSSIVSEKEETSSNSIVVYFSGSGNTERVAKEISGHIASPLYELEPVEAYSSSDLNYTSQSSRVSLEHQQRIDYRNGARDEDVHVELKSVNFVGFDKAQYVFLGAPVWWQELSWVVDDFVRENDFTGKTIIPFATSASSSYSVDHLKELNSSGTWAERQRFSSSVSDSAVTSWLDGLGYDL